MIINNNIINYVPIPQIIYKIFITDTWQVMQLDKKFDIIIQFCVKLYNKIYHCLTVS